MRRRLTQLALLATLMLGAPIAARAAPMLVEFVWDDAVGTIADAYRGGGSLLVPWERGPSSPGHEKATHRTLTLWISSDGMNWRRTDAHITDFGNEGLTARWNTKGASDRNSLAALYGLDIGPDGSITGDAYIGVSTSRDVWNGGFTAHLRSIQTSSKRAFEAVPEPAVLPILALGALGFGFAIWKRRRP
ncbi:MAG TPA: PEP-CTERM sorting domain-containing protein [Acidobacteriota bacterium]|nr:PEP-CTERM sorting domain-containing protein [Acidobacteriota bacterium]